MFEGSSAEIVPLAEVAALRRLRCLLAGLLELFDDAYLRFGGRDKLLLRIGLTLTWCSRAHPRSQMRLYGLEP